MRGPDGAGMWMGGDSRVGFGHRRLSIIDLSQTGAQPMQSRDGRLVVTFNGEIFNYRALRSDLETRGHQFASRSDTEVLLHLYADKGDAMVHDLRGMFAFAIWDEAQRRLLLARDLYGIKPLYYADGGGTLRFASQVKALVGGGGVPKNPDPAGWCGFLMSGSVPEPFTTYSAIRALPAGSTLSLIEGGAPEIRNYQSVAGIYRQAEQTSVHGAIRSADVQFHVREALLDSVRHHLVADVPVGAFLSGGTDSGALVGLMRDAGQDELQTVTLAFGEFDGSASDESVVAGDVAAAYGTHHTRRVVSAREFQDELPRMIRAMDQPSIDGVNSWFVSKAAHELGLKVAISGLGGDELFGGYPSFHDIPRLTAWMAPFRSVPSLSRSLRTLAGRFDLARLGLSPKLAGLAEFGGSFAGAYLLRRGLFMPWELDSLVGPEVAREGLEGLRYLDLIGGCLEPEPKLAYHKVATLESCLYMRNQLLRDTDWASMQHSLEVRVPLVDSVLLQRLAPFNGALQTEDAKRYLRDSPGRPMPQSVIKPKTGFTVPIEHWIRTLQIPEAVAAGVPRSHHWSRRWAMIIRWMFQHGIEAA